MNTDTFNSRHRFYADTIDRWIPDRGARVLVVAADDTDRSVFLALGFSQVTISNLDPRLTGSEFHPYAWRFEDAEQLHLEDQSFDYVVVHAGLHHLRSPHRGLTEMYRVCRRGLIFFEARDSVTMRMLERFSLTPRYEHAAVFYNDGRFGGVNNTDIPNFIYRWTEREVEKTIACFSPTVKHRFHYRYGLSAPSTPVLEKRNLLKWLLVTVATPPFRLMCAAFPRQQNLFAAFVERPPDGERLHPWLVHEDGSPRFNMRWAAARYRTEYTPPD